MWTQEFEKLLNSEKEEFRRVVSHILSKTFIVRDIYDGKENMMRINPEYRFMERNFDLFRDYLYYGGWNLSKDNNLGVIAVQNQYEYNRIHLDKNTTLILYCLRLIFEEEREKVSLRNEVMVTTGGIVQKMIALGLYKKKPSDRDISDALKILTNHNVLSKVSGSWESFECRILIHPSILFIITNEKISRIFEMFSVQEETETAVAEMEEENVLRGGEDEL